MNRQNHPKSLNKSYCRCMFGNLRKTSSMAPFLGGCGSMVFFLSIESMGIPKFYLKRIFCSDNSLDLSISQTLRGQGVFSGPRLSEGMIGIPSWGQTHNTGPGCDDGNLETVSHPVGFTKLGHEGQGPTSQKMV
jgi:hypothetical protein